MTEPNDLEWREMIEFELERCEIEQCGPDCNIRQEAKRLGIKSGPVGKARQD